MSFRATVLGFVCAACICGPVYAAEGAQEPDVPPDASMKLSEIISKVEGRNGFHYIDQIEWDDDGYYDVVYFTTDKAKVEMKFNPVTGQPE